MALFSAGSMGEATQFLAFQEGELGQDRVQVRGMRCTCQMPSGLLSILFNSTAII